MASSLSENINPSYSAMQTNNCKYCSSEFQNLQFAWLQYLKLRAENIASDDNFDNKVCNVCGQMFLSKYISEHICMYRTVTLFFAESETTGFLRIIRYHLYIYKRYVFSPNLEGVAQKISPSCL